MRIRCLVPALTAFVALGGWAVAAPTSPPRCPTLSDGAGDTTRWTWHLAGRVDVPLDRKADDDLDLRSVSLRTLYTGTGARRLVAQVKVAKLSRTGPAEGDGHAFELGFVAAGRRYVLRAGEGVTVSAGAVDAQPATTDGKAVASFGYDTSSVVFDVAVAELERVGGTQLPDATVLSALRVESQTAYLGQRATVDTAELAAPAYELGDNRCFGPPAARLAPVGAASGTYGDLSRLQARLSRADGSAIVGRRVTFTLGSKTYAPTTDSTGLATAWVLPNDPSVKMLRIAYAGDSQAGATALSRTFTTLAEKTQLTFAVSGSGTSRAVTATLTDDDATRHPIAGGAIEWWVNGKAVASHTTNSSGRDAYFAQSGQLVEARYLGDAGRYLTTSLSRRV